MHARGRARDGLLVRVPRTRREQRQGRRRLRRRDLQRGAGDVDDGRVEIADGRDQRLERAQRHRGVRPSVRLFGTLIRRPGLRVVRERRARAEIAERAAAAQGRQDQVGDGRGDADGVGVGVGLSRSRSGGVGSLSARGIQRHASRQRHDERERPPRGRGDGVRRARRRGRGGARLHGQARDGDPEGREAHHRGEVGIVVRPGRVRRVHRARRSRGASRRGAQVRSPPGLAKGREQRGDVHAVEIQMRRVRNAVGKRAPLEDVVQDVAQERGAVRRGVERRGGTRLRRGHRADGRRRAVVECRALPERADSGRHSGSFFSGVLRESAGAGCTRAPSDVTNINRRDVGSVTRQTQRRARRHPPRLSRTTTPRRPRVLGGIHVLHESNRAATGFGFGFGRSLRSRGARFRCGSREDGQVHRDDA